MEKYKHKKVATPQEVIEINRWYKQHRKIGIENFKKWCARQSVISDFAQETRIVKNSTDIDIPKTVEAIEKSGRVPYNENFTVFAYRKVVKHAIVNVTLDYLDFGGDYHSDKWLEEVIVEANKMLQN